MGGDIENGSKTPLLIIEDDFMIGMMYEATFNHPTSTFRAVVLPTGGKGVAYFGENKDVIHLIITDRDLPDLMGEVIAQRIRQISGNPDDPYILMVSAGNPNMQHMLSSGVNELVAKPFSPDNLIRILTQANQRFQPPTS